MDLQYQSENFHGSLDYRSRFHNSFLVGMHLHEYSELLYCQSGEGIVTVNGQQLQLSGGQFIWLPPNYVHQYDFQDAEVICAVFSNDLIPLFFQQLSKKQLVVAPLEARELQPVLAGLHLLKKENCVLLSGYLNLIGAKVLAQSQLESARQSDFSLYQKVISYLAEHYTEDITLSTLAQLFGYNEKYLSHALHTLTGIHFRQFLTFYRVNHAKQLLQSQPDRSIAEIAMHSGFAAVNTFQRAFKDVCGITPSEYRKNIRK